MPTGHRRGCSGRPSSTATGPTTRACSWSSSASALLRGRWHRLFLWECILNTPLFVGFPGLVSKLWLDRDEQERYRGFYEWSDAAGAEFYARSLWRVLELVCRPGSIHYRVIPGLRRDDVLEDPQLLAGITPEDGAAWWRVVGAT